MQSLMRGVEPVEKPLVQKMHRNTASQSFLFFVFWHLKAKQRTFSRVFSPLLDQGVGFFYRLVRRLHRHAATKRNEP